MRKTWPLVSLLFTLAIIMCILLIVNYYWTARKDKPELKIEFNNPPPWTIRPGQNLTLTIAIKNIGKASAENVGINFTTSIGFKIVESGINQYVGNFPEIKPEETKILTLTITLTTAIPPGDYPFNLKVQAGNTSPLILNDKITVQLPT